MKKIVTKIALCTLTLLFAASVAFANISRDEAANIVRSEYPGAQILEIEYDVEHGVEVYEVKFRTETIRKGEVEISDATGEIISREIKTHR